MFQSQARSQSPGDHCVNVFSRLFIVWFQSQARSQSPGDLPAAPTTIVKPKSFNLRREANPLATGQACSTSSCQGRFNLRREANPLATRISFLWFHRARAFQSQARSQSPGDK